MRSALLAVLLSGTALVRPGWAQCADGSPPPCRRAAPATLAAAPNTVAVLYFDNLSRDSGDAYLADGITEEIIARLGDVERLTVKSRYAVRRLRGASPAGGPAALGRSLGVAYLVTGSVQRSGPRLRVRAELARAANGNRVWGQQFERADGDVLAITEDIARGVVTGVAGQLLPAERSALQARPTRDPEAYDRLLRGDLLLALRTPASVRRAVSEYEAALLRDSALVAAWAKLSVAYGILVQRGWTTDGRPPADSLTVRVIAAAERALALDSTSSDAWMAQGYARMVGDPQAWHGAEEGFRRAVALNPRNAEAWHQLGDLLAVTRTDTAAMAAYRAALVAEPGRPVSLLSLAGALTPAEAIAVCDSVLAVDPEFSNGFVFRAGARLRTGDTTGARTDIAAFQRVVPAGQEMGSNALAARMFLAVGDTAEARRRAEAVLQRLPPTGAVHQRIAGLLAGVLYDLGARDAALRLLERAPRGVGLWQNRANAGWQADPDIQRVFAASRPPWARS